MKPDIKYSRVPSSIHAMAITVAVLALIVSISQGGEWLASLSGNNHSRHLVLYAAAISLILGNQVLARLYGITSRTQGAGVIQAITLACWLGIALFSILTSTNAITKYAGETIRQERFDSPEYRAVQDQIAGYQQQIDALQQNFVALPASWATKRQDIQGQITGIYARIERLSDKGATLDASTTGSTLDSVESMTGLSMVQLAFLAALLLELLPTCINLQLGANTGQKRSQDATKDAIQPGKSQRSKLRAVYIRPKKG